MSDLDDGSWTVLPRLGAEIVLGNGETIDVAAAAARLRLLEVGLGRLAIGDVAPAAPQHTHGQSHSPTYSSWQMMKTRCLNPNYPDYPDYGGRGITVTRPGATASRRSTPTCASAPRAPRCTGSTTTVTTRPRTAGGRPLPSRPQTDAQRVDA